MLLFFVAHQQTADFGVVAAKTTVFTDSDGHLGQFCLDHGLQLFSGLFHGQGVDDVLQISIAITSTNTAIFFMMYSSLAVIYVVI